MPNLNSWIEAQLKRGHSREAIKKQLLKRGYSRKAVAEVDKISRLAHKKFGKNKSLFSALIFVLVLLVIIIMIGIYINKSKEIQKRPDESIAPAEPAQKVADVQDTLPAEQQPAIEEAQEPFILPEAPPLPEPPQPAAQNFTETEPLQRGVYYVIEPAEPSQEPAQKHEIGEAQVQEPAQEPAQQSSPTQG